MIPPSEAQWGISPVTSCPIGQALPRNEAGDGFSPSSSYGVTDILQ